MSRPRCSECGAPVRLVRALDAWDEHCSDACAIARWNRDVAAGAIVCVGDLTVEEIDAKLSTTGWTLPGEGAEA